MAMAAFDTLKLTRSLEGAGMARAQAEALADAFKEGIGETLATKGDIGEVKHEIAELRAELARIDTKFERRFDTQDAKFTSRIDAQDAKFESCFDVQDAKFEAALRRLELRMYVTMAAFTGLAMGVAKLIF